MLATSLRLPGRVLSRFWQNERVTRRSVTIEIDSNLVEAARAAAERAGVGEADLYERVLREVLVRDFSALMADVEAFQVERGLVLDHDEVETLAASELAALRAERRRHS